MEAFNNISLYNNMIDYAKSVVYKNKSNICHIDLVHDIILSEEITKDNYRQKIKSLFLVEVRGKDKNLTMIFSNGIKSNVELHVCKKCQESYPSDFFRNRLLKNGFVQIYYICKRCESKDCGDRQKRTDKTNELTHKQKQHIKMKATDPDYLKRRVREMQEYRKRKALEKQSM
jgi:hypothetical protein